MYLENSLLDHTLVVHFRSEVCNSDWRRTEVGKIPKKSHLYEEPSELRFIKLVLLAKSCKMIIFGIFFKHCVSSGIYEEKSSRFPIMINERCGKNACCKCHYDSSHTFNGKRGYFFPLGIKISSEFQNCYAFKSPMMT